jgi:hypothetical protein
MESKYFELSFMGASMVSRASNDKAPALRDLATLHVCHTEA